MTRQPGVDTGNCAGKKRAESQWSVSGADSKAETRCLLRLGPSEKYLQFACGGCFAVRCCALCEGEYGLQW